MNALCGVTFSLSPSRECMVLPVFAMIGLPYDLLPVFPPPLSHSIWGKSLIAGQPGCCSSSVRHMEVSYLLPARHPAL
jgi:hypothetical protein